MQYSLLLLDTDSAVSPWMVTEFVLGTKRYNILNLKHKDINLRAISIQMVFKVLKPDKITEKLVKIKKGRDPNTEF